jgi:hypothetical protein
MWILQHNCRKTLSVVYNLMESATVMNIDMVLIQEPPIGIRGNTSSATFTMYRPEPNVEYDK